MARSSSPKRPPVTATSPNRKVSPKAPKAAAGAPSQDSELYRLLIESVHEYGILMLDPTGHVLSWNPGAERIKGYQAGEIIGKHFSTFYPREDVERGKPEMELR